MIHALQLQTAAGLLVGMLVGLTGVGGGSLMTPVLILLFGYHPATAVGTDLLYAAVTKTVGGFVHDRRGTVDWRIVGRLAIGSIPAAALTLALMTRFAHPGQSAGVISTTLGVTLLLSAVAALLRERVARLVVGRRGERDPRMRGGLTVLLGAVLGVLVTMTSVGAGAIGMTLLLLLYAGAPTRVLVGSDIAHAVPLTLVAGIGHWLIGSVDLALLAALLAGSIPGVLIGSLIGTKVSERVLRPVLAFVLVLSGLRLIFR